MPKKMSGQRPSAGGGAYMLVNTVERTQKIEDVPVLLRAFEDIRKPRYEIV
jgi:hypothetical protein